MEVWKDIKGYEGLYQVSNYGRVKSLPKRYGSGRGYLRAEMILNPNLERAGYLRVNLHKHKEQRKYRVNRLVLETFNPVDGMERLHVNHNDENKENNRLDNLCWMTAKENCNHGSHNEKVSKSKYKPVLCVELGKVFAGAILAEKELGVSRQNIHKVLKGLRPKAGGYHWRYIK